MQYVPPADGPGPYADPNPGTGFEGSQLPADVFEHPQQEILNAIATGGLVASGADLTQLSQAIVNIIRATGATAALKGSVERATQTEVDAGTDDERYITPAKLKALLAASVQGRLVAIITDVKANTVAGGSFTTGAARTRDLNTLVNPFGLVSLNNAGNGPGFVLPAIPLLIKASAPANRVRAHQATLYDVTGSAVAARGTSEYADDQTSNENEPIDVQTRSHVIARFTPAAASTYEIRHECARTQNTDGFGRAGSFGGEVYTTVEIYGA